MFFDDPVRAFANLRQTLRPNGALRVIAAAQRRREPFMTTAEQAAAPLLPELPPRQPSAPAQFAFANAARVEQILKDSGWHAIDLQPIDVTCTFAERTCSPTSPASAPGPRAPRSRRHPTEGNHRCRTPGVRPIRARRDGQAGCGVLDDWGGGVSA